MERNINLLIPLLGVKIRSHTLNPNVFFGVIFPTAQLNVAVKGKGKGKSKAGPLQAWSGPEGSRKLRFPDFMTVLRGLVCFCNVWGCVCVGFVLYGSVRLM
jgi:hypothetical protein